jgi:hypothetical protein
MSLRHLKTLATLATPLALPLHWVRGATAPGDEELTFLCAGSNAATEFVAGALLQGFERSDAGRLAHPLQLRGIRFHQLSKEADLVVIDVPFAWRRVLPRGADWCMPAWVSQEVSAASGTLALPAPLLKEVRRRCRRQEYEVHFTDAPRDIERFHATLYRPYISARFDAGAVLVTEEEFAAVSRGMTLAVLTVGGVWVAGLLVQRRGTALHLGWFGSAAVPPLPGASEVLDARVIEWAAEQGVTRVVMGHSRPSLANGVVRYKHRFGAAVLPTRFPQRQIALLLRHRSPELLASIAAARFIAFRDGAVDEFRP